MIHVFLIQQWGIHIKLSLFSIFEGAKVSFLLLFYLFLKVQVTEKCIIYLFIFMFYFCIFLLFVGFLIWIYEYANAKKESIFYVTSLPTSLSSPSPQLDPILFSVELFIYVFIHFPSSKQILLEDPFCWFMIHLFVSTNLFLIILNWIASIKEIHKKKH